MILAIALLILALLWWLTRLPARPRLEPQSTLCPETAAGSTVAPLAESIDAFAARIALCRAARTEICAQYYMWRGDTSGTLLYEAMHEAAERGVRVRLLIDDNATTGLDARLAWLDGHPNISVRLFNPFALRRPRGLSYLLHPARLNRRMHNKALIVDGAQAVLGGRNIGDEYYNDMSDIGLFMDMDVLVAGEAAGAAQEAFDRYWNAEPAWPLAALVPAAAAGGAEHAAAVAKAGASEFAAEVQRTLEEFPTLDALFPPHRAEVRLLFDPPEKVLGRARRRRLMYPSLRMALGNPQHDYDLISPYFVPRLRDRRYLRGLARAGVRVRVLTNALAASDTPIVHAGYGWKRRGLLKAGIELYEYQGESRLRLRQGIVGSRIRRGTAPFARNKLHAKIFSVDRTRVFIGTFNFDPRSLFLNTEMGVVIDDADFARSLHRAFAETVPHCAWQVSLGPRGLVWRRPGHEMHHEPGTRWWQRALIALASVLPIEGLL